MNVAVRLFATLRKFAPVGAEDGYFTINLSPGSTVAALLKACHLPEKSITVIMVNGQITHPGMELAESDEVAIFPPLAGG